MLTANQLSARENKLTASRVKVLMTGTNKEVLSLYRQMLGLEEPEDLSDIWRVRLGEVTEQLNLDWYARHNDVSRRGEVVVGNPNWMACTLDGFDAQRKCPIECKHTGGRETIETIIERYQPQMHWQMMCTNSKECALSVIMGANEPIVEYLPFDHAYGKILMERAYSFMLCLETLTPPIAGPVVDAPIQQIKRYDMSDNEEWMSHAMRWIQTEGAARTAKECAETIKSLVPLDASAAYGGGVIVTRNRAGSMSLRRG